MTTAQIGNTVSVNYTGKLDDGTVFDSTDVKEPFNFTLGSDEVIPGFEDGIIGMAVGQTKIIRIPVDQAYGAHSDDLIFNVPKEEVDASGDLEIGDVLEMPLKDGNSLYANIVEITEDELVIDANHELAGEDLTFEVELLSID